MLYTQRTGKYHKFVANIVTPDNIVVIFPSTLCVNIKCNTYILACTTIIERYSLCVYELLQLVYGKN